MSHRTPQPSSRPTSHRTPKDRRLRTIRTIIATAALGGLVVSTSAGAVAMQGSLTNQEPAAAGSGSRDNGRAAAAPKPQGIAVPSAPSTTKPTTPRPTTPSTTTPRPTTPSTTTPRPTTPSTTTPRPTTPSTTTTTPPAPPPPATTTSVPGRHRILLGSAGDVESLRRQTGVHLAQHTYTYFSNNVPDAKMITVNTPGSWRQVASTQPGSPLYNDIVRWGRTIDARPYNVLLAFQHEPEMNHNAGKGSPADFVDAFRRVVTIMRSSGVDNVQYTWQMTAWSFRAPAGSRQSAAQWFPGAAYVDLVGADAYNWATCGEGRGLWVSLQRLTDPAVAFAQRYGKRTVLAEYGATSNPLRASWLNDAHRYFAANRDKFAAVFYFNRPPTNSENGDCRWTLTQQSEFAEYRQMADDTGNFTL